MYPSEKNGSASISAGVGRVAGLGRRSLVISSLAFRLTNEGIQYSFVLIFWHSLSKVFVSKGGFPTSSVYLLNERISILYKVD